MSTGVLISIPSSAFAQTAGAFVDDQNVDNLEIEEIVVTARKRDEALDDVPLAVTSLSATDLELLEIDTVADLLRQLPNTILVTQGPDFLTDISIRGQGGGRQGFSEAATGIYRNGIYIAGGGFGGRTFNRLDYFDVRAIEVYRGPQGALYGRNSVGGAVNVVSNRPSDDLTFEVSGTYENVERYEVSGIVNVPITDWLSGRFGAFYIDQNDGFITSSATGEVVDRQEFFGARGAFELTPAERLTAGVTFEYYDSRQPGFGGLGRRLNPATPVSDVDPSPFTSNDSVIGEADIQEFSVFADLAYDFDVAEFTGVFAYKRRDAVRFDEDLDHFIGFQGTGGGLTDITVTQAEDFERFGFELRLASPAGRRLTWLAGADYQTFEDDVSTINEGFSPLAGLNVVANRDEFFIDELTSFSFFGSLGYDVGDRFNVAVEARFQQDRRDFSFQELTFGAPTVTALGLEETFSRFLPALTLTYRLNEDRLVFLRGSSGFRPGAFNEGLDAEFIDFIEYDPETAYAVEAGWKGRIGRAARFALTGFYTFTEDVQGVSTLVTGPTTSSTLQNVGDTNIWGFEAEASGVQELGPGRLRWSINAATTRGSFSDGSEIFTSAGGPNVQLIDLSGARVNRTRNIVASANAFYFMPLHKGIDVFVGGGVQGEQGGFENAPGDTDSPLGRDLQDFVLLDFRIGFDGGPWRVSAYVKNANDRIYRLQQIQQNDFFNEPRKFGVTLRYRWS